MGANNHKYKSNSMTELEDAVTAWAKHSVLEKERVLDLENLSLHSSDIRGGNEPSASIKCWESHSSQVSHGGFCTNCYTIKKTLI
jgi:hypothetical protein